MHRYVRCVALAFAWFSLATGATAAAPPNLLLRVAEDLSPRLGAYGDPVAHTPSLDRRARAVRYGWEPSGETTLQR